MRWQVGVLCGLLLVSCWSAEAQFGRRGPGANRPQRRPLPGRQRGQGDVEPKVTEGMQVPNFMLPDLRGLQVSLFSFRGRPLALAFFATGGNAGQELTELQQLPEKYKDLKLSVLAVEIGHRTTGTPPQQVVQFLTAQNLTLPVLLNGGEVAMAYGVGRGGAVYLLDDDQIVRVFVNSLGPQAIQRVTEKLDFWAGKGSATFGWRDDIIIGYGQALGERDQQGRPIPEDRRRPLPPQQAIRLLRSLIPPKELAVQVDYTALDESLVKDAKRTVEDAAKVWRRVLPDLKMTYVENRDDANLLLKFVSKVLDPRDTTGARTLCIYCRALDEGQGRGGRVNRDGGASSVKVVAQVGVEHGDEREHNAAGVTHLVAAAFGYALGLDLCGDGERGRGMRNPRDPGRRNDKSSITYDNADAPTAVLRPSPDDLIIIRNVHSALHYQIGRLLVETKRYAEAQQELKQVAPNTPFAALAQEELKKIP